MNLLNITILISLLLFTELGHALNCNSIPPPVNDGDAGLHATLQDAIICGRKDSVRWLVAHGVSVNAIDESGNTPLMFAIDNLHPEMVQVLLDVNADVFIHQKWTGQTARQIAVDHSKYDRTYLPIVRLLESHGSLEYLGDTLPTSEFDIEIRGQGQTDITGGFYSRLFFLGPSYRFFAVGKAIEEQIPPPAAANFYRPPSTVYAVLPNHKVVKLAATTDFTKLGIKLQSESDALALVRLFTNSTLGNWVKLHFNDIDLVEIPLELSDYRCLSIAKEPLKRAGIVRPSMQTKVDVRHRKSFVVTRYMIPSSVDFGFGGNYSAESVTQVIEYVSEDGAYTSTRQAVSTPGFKMENHCRAR